MPALDVVLPLACSSARVIAFDRRREQRKVEEHCTAATVAPVGAGCSKAGVGSDGCIFVDSDAAFATI